VLLPELYGTARRLARNAADAEDLVAETVARAWEHRGSLRDRTTFRGWVFRILTNTYLGTIRAARARPAMEPLSTAVEETGESFSLFERLHQPFLLWWGNPEQEFLNKLLREDFERALEGLPENFRVVVVLADVEEMSYAEIAESLGVPLGTVRSRLARGRSLLQRALWEHAVDAGLAPGRHTSLPTQPETVA
jgi:RNA polymerase sigma-70 factor (ECF subfamily)